MSRKKRVIHNYVLPDIKYSNTLITKFINYIMKQGRKITSERILYTVLDELKSKKQDDPVKVFTKAIENVKPVLETRSRRVGGATYQVPVEVRENRQIALAFRWILLAAKSRSEKTIINKLTGEILDAYENKGIAIKKKEDTHKMAEANRAFAHYRW
ncbi:MAG: 30S ribosomal protein S7 [Deltaproteobacteria bacterium]|nr:30S ribosomal protein S7 [Deltaproteobacteria bacterium]